MPKVLSEAATFRLAQEAVVGTAPGAGTWTQMQPNPGGIELDPELETVERDPLSVYATDEKGDVVGLKADVKITHDLNMDWLRIHATAMMRAVAKHPGGTALAVHRPTAAVAGSPGSFTVPTTVALVAGTLIYVFGALNPVNNGLHVVAAASTTTSFKVATAGIIAETLPANAMLVVVGVEATAADVKIDASNNLTSTTLNLSTLGLVKGMGLIIGDTAVGTRFNSLPLTRPAAAYIKSAPAAGLIELEDHNWPVAGADVGAGKTIRIFFGLYLQNYPISDKTNYATPTYHGELEDQDAATGNTVPVYTYGKGLAAGMFEINAPLKNKIVVTTSYVGTDIPDPVLTASRATGPATAFAPLTTAMFDTTNDLEEVALYDSTGKLVSEVNSWKLSINHNVKAREVQGILGAVDHIFGKIRPSISFEGYFVDYDQVKAARSNRDLKWRFFLGNHQGGMMFRMPYTALRQPKKSYAANEAVMLGGGVPGFRDPATNVVMQMTLFGYVPFGGASV